MKAEDIIGTWTGDGVIQADGSVKKGHGKGKMDLAADGTATIKVAFLKLKAKWEIQGDAVSMINVNTGESVGTMTLVDGKLRMHNENGTTSVYTRA